jgi:iron complex transport system ATP-binding protein
VELQVPGRVLCRDLSIEFNAGEVWAVLGRNGAGKSTLLHALAGLASPAAGRVEMTIEHVSVDASRARSRAIGVLLQIEDGNYWGSVGEYVLLGRYPYTHPLKGYSAHDLEEAKAALESLDLMAYAQRRFTTLSGGERQRVRIAQIFAQGPRVYLLDEPLQHLDLAHQAQVLRLIATRAHERAHTVIMVLHEPLWITRACTHAVILSGDGRAHCGRADELLTRERLEYAYGCKLREVEHGAGRSFVPDV